MGFDSIKLRELKLETFSSLLKSVFHFLVNWESK